MCSSSLIFLGRLRDVCSERIRPEEIDVLNVAFKEACIRLKLTGSTPVIELVALRLLEVVRAGESDHGRLTEATISTFKG